MKDLECLWGRKISISFRKDQSGDNVEYGLEGSKSGRWEDIWDLLL